MIAQSATASVINLRAYTDPAAIPTLVLVDLQREYVAAPRRLAMPEAVDAIGNCSAALSHARDMGFPVAFVRWIGHTPFFNPATPFSSWIDGFAPNGTDMVFERNRPSCYASDRFAEVMELGSGANIVMAGFAGETACLSTAIDAFHRGHRVTFLSDASASHAIHDIGAAEMHRTVGKLIGLYAEVMTTQAWTASTKFWPTTEVPGNGSDQGGSAR